MQARTYLALGDGIAAAAEIERARQLSIPASETSHLMAHALLLQDEPDRALAELETVSPAHAAYASRICGQALASPADEEAAATECANAVDAAPRDNDARTDSARFSPAPAHRPRTLLPAPQPVTPPH